MKYRTFRNIVLLGGAATLAGLDATCFHFAGSIQTGGGETVASGASRAAGTGRTTVTTPTPYPVTRVSTAPAAPPVGRPQALAVGELFISVSSNYLLPR